jgi:hypothetical protein
MILREKFHKKDNKELRLVQKTIESTRFKDEILSSDRGSSRVSPVLRKEKEKIFKRM